jgi:hypothetical protein
MSTVRFLVDEPVAAALAKATRQREPAIDLLAVDEPNAPPKGTKDPELLVWCEAHRFLLVTIDRNTMPIHIDVHLKGGHHTWGVLQMRDGFAIPRYVDDLLLIWSASTAEEWFDKDDWLPL